MNKYCIEPVQTKSELDLLNSENIVLNDFTFLIKNEDAIVGYSQLTPIKKSQNKALWVHKIICNDIEATKKLLTEVAMYSWELGYDAIFCDCSNPVFKEAGFIELDSTDIGLSLSPNSILALELSWNGLKKLEKLN